MFCDIDNLDGSPFEGDPRQVLKRNLDRARERGFSFYVAPEMEFFYFADGDPTRAARAARHAARYFDLTTADVASDLRKRTIHTLEAMGIPVEYSFHEDAPSQHEIDLRYTDALTMADNVMTFRLVVREIALEQGVLRHVHAEAAGRRAGLGHAHPPVAVRGRRRTPSTTRATRTACRRSAAASSPGCSHHAPRDHRGHQPAGELLQAADRRLPRRPVHVAWARNNRSALVRVPVTKTGKESSTRIEYRSPDPACNPYLAFSVMLAAGLEGHRARATSCPPEATANVFELTAEERAAEGIRRAARSRCPRRST